MAAPTRLRLWRDSTPDGRRNDSASSSSPDRTEPRELRFPTEAVRNFHRRGQDEPAQPDPAISSRQLIRHIEATLDRMQSKLDDVKAQVDDAFRLSLPSDDDYRPSAA